MTRVSGHFAQYGRARDKARGNHDEFGRRDVSVGVVDDRDRAVGANGRKRPPP
jgi:hypothetical protein